jgi:hypothetical protein
MVIVLYGSISRPWDSLDQIGLNIKRSVNRKRGEGCGWMAESTNLFCDIEWHLFSLFFSLASFPTSIVATLSLSASEGEGRGWSGTKAE